MSRRLSTRFSDMPVDEHPDATITQEVSDRKLEQEDSESDYSVSNVEEDEDGEEDEDDENWPFRKIKNYICPRTGKVIDEVWVSSGGRAPRAPVAYNWDQAASYAKAKARELHIVEIASDETARVMKDGQLVGIFHVDGVDAVKSFVVYDGLDVLARVQGPSMETAVHHLAALHVGRQLGWAHPLDHKLDFSSVHMKGRLAGGYAVKMSLMAEEPARKQNKRVHEATA